MTARPLRRQTIVACSPAAARELWLHGLDTWWPLDGFSVFGPDSTVEVRDRDIVETAPDGRTAVWGTITSDEDDRLAFTWHPGRGPETASQIAVTFVRAAEEATLVTLVHDGWDSYPDPEATRAHYATGWATVLDRLAATRAAPGGADLWLVLEHRAGPARPPGGVFSSPDFRKHLAFLTALRQDGLLVAAGSLPDEAGAGMTIVRVGDAAAAAAVIRRAELDDGSVVAGLLEVRARPWNVALTG
ncbi:SRPBCC domain-containing protein [Gryllotalpicola ginsengisoli]|uniref:SRPBCC domain-containing protein n=1 Tax=Gryllotalpicola ginsengisoli TaxID=444608 RepID=UPI0003B7855C|nr:SRPBCC domain-containing protein [Gryllotalpicola ginsengisoli]